MNMWQNIVETTNQYFQSGLVTFLITLVLVLVAVEVLRSVIRKFIRRLIEKDKLDETSGRFARRIVVAIVYTVAFFGVVTQIIPLRNVSVSLLAGSGVAVLVIGFAAQEAFSNIIAGFFISFFRPYSVGDLIELPESNISGYVEDINLRHTIIRTFTNQAVVIPNSIMNKTIVENKDSMDKRAKNFFQMSIGYASDIDLARKIMIEEISKHPSLLDTRTPKELSEDVPLVNVILLNLGDFSVDLRATIWSADFGSGWSMVNDLRESCKKRFDEAGIDIPFPSHNIYMQK